MDLNDLPEIPEGYTFVTGRGVVAQGVLKVERDVRHVIRMSKRRVQRAIPQTITELPDGDSDIDVLDF